MLQKSSVVQISDNSGAKFGKCIHVYGGYRKRYSFVGQKLLIAVLSMKRIRNRKRINSKEKTKQSAVVKAILIRSKQTRLKNNSSKMYFNDNSVVLINEKNKLIGTRIFGPVARKIRQSRFLRIASLAQGTLPI